MFATVPSPDSPSVEDVLTNGVCAECKKPISGHIDPETKSWVGCNAATTAELPQGAHPLRRATDVVLMVPLTILMNAITPIVVPRTEPQPGRERRTTQRPTLVRSTSRGGAKVNATRGKPAGRYVATGKQPSKMTESMNRVYFAMRNNKRGIVAKQLSERLNMAEGTLAWSLSQLVKEGAIVHVRPGQHADALIAAANK